MKVQFENYYTKKFFSVESNDILLLDCHAVRIQHGYASLVVAGQTTEKHLVSFPKNFVLADNIDGLAKTFGFLPVGLTGGYTFRGTEVLFENKNSAHIDESSSDPAWTLAINPHRLSNATLCGLNMPMNADDYPFARTYKPGTTITFNDIARFLVVVAEACDDRLARRIEACQRHVPKPSTTAISSCLLE
ncbi:MAG: hypothetical protein WC464_04275 [Bdellovibrionales bacterium]